MMAANSIEVGIGWWKLVRQEVVEARNNKPLMSKISAPRLRNVTLAMLKPNLLFLDCRRYSSYAGPLHDCRCNVVFSGEKSGEIRSGSPRAASKAISRNSGAYNPRYRS